MPESTPQPPQPEPTPAPAPKYLWDNYANARHSARVICDEEGLTLAQKEDVCACIEEESHFQNYINFGTSPTIHRNHSATTGALLSTDWGIVQINDHYHIGPKLDFSSVDYLMTNPDRAVRFMARMCKAGLLKLWVSYSSGAYKKYLPK